MSPVPAEKGVPDLVRWILQSCGFTLFHVSQESVQSYRDKMYHIPHQFYSDLGPAGFTPSIQQVLTFSSITGYRITDWLAVFGFALDTIPRMQATLPAQRTRLLDATIYDDQQWIPWFADNSLPRAVPAILPLGNILSPSDFRKAGSFLGVGHSPFLYAKVGWQDAFAYPDLLPGSVVRVDTRKKGDASPAASRLRTILSIEHTKGFCFSRVHFPGAGCITIRSTELPYSSLECRLGRDARILGAADVELRPLASVCPQEPSLLEFLYAIPRGQLVRPGHRRSLMRRALRGIVPGELLTRKRKAFVDRAPRMAISEEWENLVQERQEMICTSLRLVDQDHLLDAMHKARQGHEVRIVPLLRTLALEYWLRHVAHHGVFGSLSSANDPMEQEVFSAGKLRESEGGDSDEIRKARNRRPRVCD